MWMQSIAPQKEGKILLVTEVNLLKRALVEVIILNVQDKLSLSMYFSFWNINLAQPVFSCPILGADNSVRCVCSRSTSGIYIFL